MRAYREVRVLSYKRDRARLALSNYVRLTPRNGKYTDTMRAERGVFESTLLGCSPRD